MFLLETKFGDLVKAFRTFGVAFFWQFVETAFFVSMTMLKIYIHFLTKIYGPILFFDCGQKMFELLAKKFRQGGQNFNPRVHRNFRGSDVSGREISSFHFWSLSGKFFDVFENFIFWSPLNFSENIFLFVKNQTNIVENWTKICAFSGQKLRRSVKFPYYISNCFLDEKVISEIVKMFAFDTLSKKA